MYAGARLMAFLAGPPNRGQGSVLKRKQPPPPLVPPSMADISYTSLALGLQPSPTLPTHTTNSNGIANGGDPEEVGPAEQDQVINTNLLVCSVQDT